MKRRSHTSSSIEAGGGDERVTAARPWPPLAAIASSIRWAVSRRHRGRRAEELPARVGHQLVEQRSGRRPATPATATTRGTGGCSPAPAPSSESSSASQRVDPAVDRRRAARAARSPPAPAPAARGRSAARASPTSSQPGIVASSAAAAAARWPGDRPSAALAVSRSSRMTVTAGSRRRRGSAAGTSPRRTRRRWPVGGFGWWPKR